MKGITEKQQRILDFINEFREANGIPPTVQEIADNIGVKGSTAFAHLRALQRKNQIARSSKARSIALTHPRITMAQLPHGIWTIPLLGCISAGEPAESVAMRGEEYRIPAGFGGCASEEGLFALRVQGESMRDLGIMDGDVVIVKPLDAPPRPGDIVAAVVPGGECTVKSYYPHDAHSIELRPANPDYHVQIHPVDQVRLQGKVIALQRQY